ncbi:HTH-type transcriptional repressor GlcR [Paenibacillus baekrokdamisoli]|uniref:HTH-type transcriptional repressor GlcR n=1 Tax=Paenibacillus baekrokdamisoli TaxID=1712516 RepID=A0A3G9J2Q1_9BACL|nr:DeoR/GlpR family DNA-binding transcription regulator [Paenibacillus baekrokdamisoli]MBB3070752.1 DeoR/GlpR family transcriptional regulator of sugar metabolism [Paenibacillus baekrokdamisoli]BBH20101.1 HTH-type transcriptional repressor GlcR [Paenibacillus baekrokdamisoli]
MYQEERLLKILTYLNQHRTMSVNDICVHFGISRDTARRDIVRLVQEGVVIRTHGGLALPELKKEISSYQDRLIDESNSKNQIGKQGARLIQDQETLFLDVSTTVQFVAEHISAKEITVVTHSIDNVGILSNREDLQIYVLGGYLHAKHRLLHGSSVIDKISEMHADKAFIGATAIRSDGIYYPFEDDARVKKEMARRSDQVIVVADHTKFSGKSSFKLDFDWVDILITDQDIPDEIREVLDQKNITVIVCQENSQLGEETSNE